MARPSALGPDSPAARAGAALTALVAWIGLGLQVNDTLPFHHGALLPTLWGLAAYFTILTNLLVAGVFTGAALERAAWRAPRLIGGTLLAILLVGVVYWTLLHARMPPRPGTEVANALVHAATPLLVLGWWLAFGRRGELRARDALLWALFPVAYFAYALVRGAATGRYPYFFIGAASLGYLRVTLNAAGIAAAFVVAGLGIVALDQRLAKRTPR